MKKKIENINGKIIITYDDDKIKEIKSLSTIFGKESKYYSKYDNNKKYIFSEGLTNFESYLNEFPEYLTEEYITFATNTGFLCFYKENELVIYNLLEEDTNSLSDIKPDIRFFNDYNHISTPVNVRKVNYDKNNNFIADKYYTEGDVVYSFFNCDKIDSAEVEPCGYFKCDNSTFSIAYNYKPIIYIRAYKSDGTKNTELIIYLKYKKYTEEGEAKLENIECTNIENIYYFDCSTIAPGEDLILSLDSNKTSGYLEVL